MSQPAPPPAAITKQDVYRLCPDVDSFRASHPRPLRGVWRTVNNDFGSYKRKQKQKQKCKAHEAGITDEAAYAHTREVALRKRDITTTPAATTFPAAASTSTCPPAPSSVSPSAEMLSHSAIREAFGNDCFPWAYWASQGSTAKHRLTGYYLTERQWTNRVMKLIKTLGDRNQLHSWNQHALDHRPFDDRHIERPGGQPHCPLDPMR
jgi:hypothetical protein